MSLPQDVAAMAESIVNTLTQTDYQHVDNIDPSTGVYDCDCNGFAAFILRAVALQNFEEIPIDTQLGSLESRPRAFEYYDFFASLTPQSTGGWSRVNLPIRRRSRRHCGVARSDYRAACQYWPCRDPRGNADARSFRGILRRASL
jgi:hypothetical protein